MDTFHLLGYLCADGQGKKVSRFDLVALSPTGHYDQIGQKNMPLGVAFELAPATVPANRVRPHSYYQAYFGPR
jgi:hypothetical protein